MRYNDPEPRPMPTRRRRRRWPAALTAAALALSLAPSTTNAIVGGQPTTVEAHPYFVRVGVSVFTFSSHCGGTLIDDDVVLTAAHCVEGAANYAVSPAAGGTIDVAEVVRHPLYTSTNSGYDLAILRLEEAVPTEAGTPIRVGAPYDSGADAPGNSATAVGRGMIDVASETYGFHQATMPIVSDGTMLFLYDFFVNNHPLNWQSSIMIGAGSSSTSTCHGDSGGPLYTERSIGRVQIGVTSTGYPNCNRPAVFTELNGANLAWLATQEYSISEGWGGCAYNGAAGRPHVRYGTHYTPGLNRDGPFYWTISCQPVDGFPPGGGTPPGGGDPAPEPPICMLRPDRCPIDW